jgi:hypothetical protein
MLRTIRRHLVMSVRSRSPQQNSLKYRSWTLPVILGLLLGLIGGPSSVELLPQMAVFPQEPIEKSQPFSVPFRIDNTGYLPFFVEHVYCYAIEIKAASIRMRHIVEAAHKWDHLTLNRGESKTIFCHTLKGPAPPQEADIAIVVEYKAFAFLPWTVRKLVRFNGAFIDNWQWLKQPSGEIESEANEKIDEIVRLARK